MKKKMEFIEYELCCYPAVEKCALADSWLEHGSG